MEIAYHGKIQLAMLVENISNATFKIKDPSQITIG